MKKFKFFMATLLTAAMSITSMGAIPVAADDDVRPSSVRFSKSTRTVYPGQDFDLEVKTTPHDADDDYLYWSIVGKKGIIRFDDDDDDRTDDEMEFKALKAGTTKVRCSIRGTSKKAEITIEVKKPTYKFERIGPAKRTIEDGDDFELKVRKLGGTRDRDLRWYIEDKSIVRFDDDDDDRCDNDMEFEARRPGKTTIACRNLKTKERIAFTITVVPDRDDDWDDDDWDDDDWDD